MNEGASHRDGGTTRDSARVRLRAEDPGDLETLSGLLQDAIVRTGDMVYHRDRRRFALVANRFRWEHAPEPLPGMAEGEPQPPGDAAFEDVGTEVYERVHCGVRFDAVDAVRCRGVDLKDPSRLLSLMAVTHEARPEGGGRITLTFSQDGAIRLEVDRILCHLEDLDEPWPTIRRPHHALAEDDAADG